MLPFARCDFDKKPSRAFNIREDKERTKILMDENEQKERQEEETATGKDAENSAVELVEQVKAEYEKKLAEQKEQYEKRLEDRNAVIAQLINGKEKPAPSAFDILNEKRKRNARY